MKPAICFTRKKQQQQQKDQKKKKNICNSESWTPDLGRGRLTWLLSIVPRQLVLKILLKLIIFNTFAREILLVDAV